MIRTAITLFFLVLNLTNASAQKDFKLLFEINRESQFILADNLKNIYLISEFGISMYGPNGVLRFENSIKNLGHITSVDLNFSLKPMVFFKDMNSIVVLDNTMSMQGNPVRLSQYDLNWASVASKSADNHYWFFDSQTLELIRTDLAMKKVRSSGNISQMLGIDLKPNFIVEHNGWVYMNNPETGILVFDIYGTYFKQIPIKNLTRLQVTDQFILYLQNEKLFQYNLKTFETKELSIPAENASSVQISKDLLFISDSKSVRAYQIN